MLKICYDNILNSFSRRIPHISVSLQHVISTVTSQVPHIIPLTETRPAAFTLLDLKKQGFQVKEGYSGAWSKLEQDLVSGFMLELLRDPESFTYFDHFTYISRKILDGSKSRGEVKKYLINKLKRQDN